MRKFGQILILLVLAWWIISPARAHLTLVSPPARTGASGLTEDPCGNVMPGEPVVTYPAGATVDIQVDLVVDHVHRLKAVISHDRFVSRKVLSSIQTQGEGNYTMTVQLPDGPLGPATLQATDGTYVSCADIALTGPESFEINAGLNDAWYFPGTGGQGFFIVVFPEIETLFLAWFTFDTERPPESVTAVLGEPGHRWITAQGPFSGNTASLDVVVTSGGLFDSEAPAPVNSGPGSVGSMEVSFESCYRGVVKYDLPALGLSGEVPIQRIVNDNVALCESLDSGQ